MSDSFRLKSVRQGGKSTALKSRAEIRNPRRRVAAYRQESAQADFVFQHGVLKPCEFATTVAPEKTTPVLPRIDEDVDDTGTGSGYIVVVYDNDYNTVPEVIMILMQATTCSLDEAQMETWEIHNLGKSVVHHGNRPECERAAGIIRTIGIRVEVVEE